MIYVRNFTVLIALLTTFFFLNGCGMGNGQTGNTSTGGGGSATGSSGSGTSNSGSGSGSGSSGGSGSGGSGSGGSGSGPSTGNFAAGIGGAGQTQSAQFLVAIQLPGYYPIPTKINSDGTLSLAKLNAPPAPKTATTPMAMAAAIDPSGSYLYQAVSPGIYGYSINRQSGDLTQMANFPVAPAQNFQAIVVDQLGKFVYAYDGAQLFGYAIQSGTGQLSPIPGSPFSAGPSGQQYFAGSNRLAVSQDDNHLYLATSNGILGFSIDHSTGTLTALPGSPFGTSAGSAFAVAAPASGFLYETVMATTPQPNTGIIGYSIDQKTGALTALPGSPFGPACAADNLTSPASGKFLFAASCGMYTIDPATGALMHVANDPAMPSTPIPNWAVFDPAGAFIWLITYEQNCWHCDIGVTSYQVDARGTVTPVPHSFVVMQNDNSGGISSLAITH